MPNRCVAGGCNNAASQEKGIKVHVFPSDERIRSQWIRFVGFRRKDFVATKTSQLCSLHFLRSCYEEKRNLVTDKTKESGYREESVWVKKKGAIPTVLDPLKSAQPCGIPVTCPPAASQPLENAKPRSSRPNTSRQQSLYTLKRIRTEVVEGAVSEYDQKQHQLSLLSTTDNGSDNDAIDGAPLHVIAENQPELSSTSRTSKFVMSIVAVENIMPNTDKKSVSCQTTPETISCHSVKSQCTIVGHEFVNLPADYVLPGNQTADLQSNTTPQLSSTPVKVRPSNNSDTTLDGNSTFSATFIDDEMQDPNWNADLSFDNSEPDDDLGDEVKVKKLYVVSEDKLLSLFKVCQKCGHKGAEATVASLHGTLVTVEQQCLSCEEPTKWSSQDIINGYPYSNIALSAALLSSGNVPSKALRMLNHWGVQAIVHQTFTGHQRKFLNQAVRNVWEEDTIRVMSNLEEVVQLSGDARCDSMGHNAKYASYSLHDTETNAIICTELVVSTEPDTKKSAAMEVLGLSRALGVVDDYCPHLEIKLITDGHTGVAKYVRENHPDKVTHYLDIWHVAKGIKKRLTKLVKRFPEVGKWKRSIINHLYWCAVTSNNNGELILAKWTSIANHIANVHEHDNELYPRCSHGKIGLRCWFDTGSEAYDTLCHRVILNKLVLKSVKRLSSDAQTSGLEGFHSLVNQFSPKMYHFGYQAMKSRVELAALHFNENSKRAQRKTRDGSLSYNIRYPKSRGGQYIVTQVMKEPTYEYAGRVLEETIRLVKTGETYVMTDDPPNLASLHAPPASKEEAVLQHRSRFNMTT